MARRRASGPKRTPGTEQGQKFIPKAYHPADRAHPVAGSTSQAYHRVKACARHAIGADQDWLGRPFWGPAYAHPA